MHYNNMNFMFYNDIHEGFGVHYADLERQNCYYSEAILSPPSPADKDDLISSNPKHVVVF